MLTGLEEEGVHADWLGGGRGRMGELRTRRTRSLLYVAVEAPLLYVAVEAPV
jgi:hypothetical protein